MRAVLSGLDYQLNARWLLFSCLFLDKAQNQPEVVVIWILSCSRMGGKGALSCVRCSSVRGLICVSRTRKLLNEHSSVFVERMKEKDRRSMTAAEGWVNGV